MAASSPTVVCSRVSGSVAAATIASATIDAGAPPATLSAKKAWIHAWSAAYTSSTGSSALMLLAAISVSKKPGSMETTRMPYGSTSEANASLTALRADFDAAYMLLYITAGTRLANELTLITTPDRCSRIVGRTACTSRIGPQKLVSIRCMAVSSDMLSIAPRLPTPALLTSTSMVPWAPSTRSTAAVIDDPSLTSSCSRWTSSPSSAALFRSSSALLRLRIVATTVSPRRAKASAASRPNPLLHPVISTTPMCQPPVADRPTVAGPSSLRGRDGEKHRRTNEMRRPGAGGPRRPGFDTEVTEE